MTKKRSKVRTSKKGKKSFSKFLLRLLIIVIGIVVINYQDDIRDYYNFKSKYSLKNCNAAVGEIYLECFRQNFIDSMNKSDIDAIVFIHAEAAKVIGYEKKKSVDKDKKKILITSIVHLCDSAILALNAIDGAEDNRTFTQKIMNMPLQWLRNKTISHFKSSLASRCNRLINSILSPESDFSNIPRFSNEIERLKLFQNTFSRAIQ